MHVKEEREKEYVCVYEWGREQERRDKQQSTAASYRRVKGPTEEGRHQGNLCTKNSFELRVLMCKLILEGLTPFTHLGLKCFHHVLTASTSALPISLGSIPLKLSLTMAPPKRLLKTSSNLHIAKSTFHSQSGPSFTHQQQLLTSSSLKGPLSQAPGLSRFSSYYIGHSSVSLAGSSLSPRSLNMECP